MKTETELMKAVKAYRDHLELEAEIERINDQIEENAQLVIKLSISFICVQKMETQIKRKCGVIEAKVF
ncbi:MAG: hypothetical protein KAI83_11840 [Thiomargarita sp.]|nr:hypothetical protein [Thiomargarita sp.]